MEYYIEHCNNCYSNFRLPKFGGYLISFKGVDRKVNTGFDSQGKRHTWNCPICDFKIIAKNIKRHVLASNTHKALREQGLEDIKVTNQANIRKPKVSNKPYNQEVKRGIKGRDKNTETKSKILKRKADKYEATKVKTPFQLKIEREKVEREAKKAEREKKQQAKKDLKPKSLKDIKLLKAEQSKDDEELKLLQQSVQAKKQSIKNLTDTIDKNFQNIKPLVDGVVQPLAIKE